MRMTFTCASKGASELDLLRVETSMGTPGLWFTGTNDDPTNPGAYTFSEVLLSPEQALDLADRIIKEVVG